ncbi:hypothetical protein AB0K52_25265 [Glycomyces sp. NPDC049804]|uniref:hypothetical protein n=1 Tax=Glycomyces sp. NPDC049804 TaxID=3154363 RepID=UPI00343E71FF
MLHRRFDPQWQAHRTAAVPFAVPQTRHYRVDSEATERAPLDENVHRRSAPSQSQFAA